MPYQISKLAVEAGMTDDAVRELLDKHYFIDPESDLLDKITAEDFLNRFGRKYKTDLLHTKVSPTLKSEILTSQKKDKMKIPMIDSWKGIRKERRSKDGDRPPFLAP